MNDIREILAAAAVRDLTRNEIVSLLGTHEADEQLLFDTAATVKSQYVGNITYFRGLVEWSNICAKNCLYCGIRHDNHKVIRYCVDDTEIMNAANYAAKRHWGSLVIQSGERQDKTFVNKVERMVKSIRQKYDLGITLSCGEQTIDTYRRWFEAGATRYLLRIEASDEELYYKIHINDRLHSYKNRLQALYDLQKTGYMTGTGVMIGLPFQTHEHLAGDLLFMKDFDIDMCGMGPYLEHADTPLYAYRHLLPSETERFNLTMKMVAILRIIMKDVNIASTTALQVIDPNGREKMLKVGANVIMPNITPVRYHEDYNIYVGKPKIAPETDDYIRTLEEQIRIAGDAVGYGQKGDPKHYFRRRSGQPLTADTSNLEPA